MEFIIRRSPVRPFAPNGPRRRRSRALVADHRQIRCAPYRSRRTGGGIHGHRRPDAASTRRTGRKRDPSYSRWISTASPPAELHVLARPVRTGASSRCTRFGPNGIGSVARAERSSAERCRPIVESSIVRTRRFRSSAESRTGRQRTRKRASGSQKPPADRSVRVSRSRSVGVNRILRYGISRRAVDRHLEGGGTATPAACRRPNRSPFRPDAAAYSYLENTVYTG